MNSNENNMLNNTGKNAVIIPDIDEQVVSDSSMDLLSLINSQKANAKNPDIIQGKSNNIPEKSALEKAKEYESKRQVGAVVTNEEIERSRKDKPKKNPIYNDQRIESIEEELSHYDDMMSKRAAVVQIKEAKNELEYTKMMDEINSVVFRKDGNAVFKYTDNYGHAVEPEFVRLRTESDPPFTGNGEEDGKLKNNPAENNIANSESINEINTVPVEETDNEKKKREIVKILIDKTGLGSPIEFTEEEKQKLVQAEEIQLTEVEIMDLETADVETVEASAFQELINGYQFSGERTTISFPASGFHAQMMPMTYGEYSDIAVSMESITFDEYYKRMSVVYNKMKNISIGNFPSFIDFLKGFAYTDIPLAIYALCVSTFPEIQSIQLSCGNKNCKKEFTHNFQTRSILDLEKSDMLFLEKMKELAHSTPADYDTIRSQSAIKKSKLIQLPHTKIRFEMGVVSAYDFLYNFIPLMDQKTFVEVFGEDASIDDAENILLLTSIRSVSIPNPKGSGYIRATGYRAIINALYKITPEEMKLVRSIAAKVTGAYQAHFSFGKVVCPHCGDVTDDLEVNIDELVFQTFNRLRSTEINVENIHVL